MRLKFWLRAVMNVIGSILLSSAIYGAMMVLMSDNTSPLDALSVLPLYIMMFGAFMQMGYGLTLLKTTANLALSMGETRRSAFLGLILVTLLPILGVSALTAAVTALLSVFGVESIFSLDYMVPLGIAVGLFMSSVGLVIAMVQRRFGTVVSVISGILLVLLAIGFGFCAGLGLFDAINLGALLKAISWWSFTLAGFIVYGIVLIPLHRTVCRFAVTL